MGATGFDGSFTPIVQHKKWEIHPVFPHFPYFRSGQNFMRYIIMTDKERMDRIHARKSVLNPLVIILRAHFYPGNPVCASCGANSSDT